MKGVQVWGKERMPSFLPGWHMIWWVRNGLARWSGTSLALHARRSTSLSRPMQRQYGQGLLSGVSMKTLRLGVGRELEVHTYWQAPRVRGHEVARNRLPLRSILWPSCPWVKSVKTKFVLDMSKAKEVNLLLGMGMRAGRPFVEETQKTTEFWEIAISVLWEGGSGVLGPSSEEPDDCFSRWFKLCFFSDTSVTTSWPQRGRNRLSSLCAELL